MANPVANHVPPSGLERDDYEASEGVSLVQILQIVNRNFEEPEIVFTLFDRRDRILCYALSLHLVI